MILFAYKGARKIKRKQQTQNKFNLKLFLLGFIIVLLSLIPIALSIASYNSTNKNTDLLALNQINVSIYDKNNFLLETEKNNLLYSKEDSLVKIIHAILTNKTPLRSPPPPGSLNQTPIIASITSDKINETLTCYFSGSESYCMDSSGTWYKIDKTDALAFLESPYSETLHEHATLPSLLTIDGDTILPNSIDWYYKNIKNDYVESSKNKSSNDILSYDITDSLMLDFDVAPDICQTTVFNEKDEQIFSGTLHELSKIAVNSNEIIRINLYAEWKKTEQSLYYGSATYEFDVTIRNHSDFYISSNEISYGEFIVLRCTNISSIDDLEFSTNLENSHLNFSYDGDILKCLINYPDTHNEDTFSISVKYGASHNDFTIRINKDSQPSNDNIDFGDSDAYSKLTRILSSAPQPETTQNAYINGSFSSPLSHGYTNASFPVAPEYFGGVEFIANEQAQKVLATNSGKVVLVTKTELLGNIVVIDHCLGIQTWYCGLSDIYVSEGDYVVKDEVIGRSGTCELSSSNGFLFLASINGNMIDSNNILEKTI